MVPSSIFTGSDSDSARRGRRSTSRIPGSRPHFSAALSNWRVAIRKGLSSSVVRIGTGTRAPAIWESSYVRLSIFTRLQNLRIDTANNIDVPGVPATAKSQIAVHGQNAAGSDVIGRLVDDVDHAVGEFVLVHDAPCAEIRRQSDEGPCEETRAERSVRPHNSGAGRG